MRSMRSLLALSFALFFPSLYAAGSDNSPQTVLVPQVAKLTASGVTYFFGLSVAIDGDTAIVGTPSGLYTLQGAAYVFTRPKLGWRNMTQVAVLTASDAKEFDGFGCSAAISGDTVVVGAPGASYDTCNISPGAVYVFVKPATGWTDMTETAKLIVPSSVDTFNAFGSSVAISGDVVVAGAPGLYFYPTNGVGAAYVFVKPINGWSNILPTARLTTSDAMPAGDLFGWSVCISGNTVAVGAPGKNATYIFVEPPGGWANITQTAKLTASTGDPLGDSVAISGNTVVSGSAANEGQGAAYVFVMPPGGWINMTETAELTAPGSGTLGSSVAATSELIIAGALDTSQGQNGREGAAYVYVKPKGGWKTTADYNARLTGSDARKIAFFGRAVAVSGNTIVSGAPRAFGGLVNGVGAAYMYGSP
jgi:hypothetical protein